jgi:hypothetical protein
VKSQRNSVRRDVNAWINVNLEIANLDVAMKSLAQRRNQIFPQAPALGVRQRHRRRDEENHDDAASEKAATQNLSSQAGSPE